MAEVCRQLTKFPETYSELDECSRPPLFSHPMLAAPGVSLLTPTASASGTEVALEDKKFKNGQTLVKARIKTRTRSYPNDTGKIEMRLASDFAPSMTCDHRTQTKHGNDWAKTAVC